MAIAYLVVTKREWGKLKHVSNHAVCLTSKGNVEEDDGIGSLVINTTVTVSSSSHADGKSQIKFYVISMQDI